ncbi:hypothetical protein BCF33_1107 [Hasllibacter halocynthiae]|uniref:Uncharacterized protein n=1 Tax=Hasllibacter halocynthiae TaxID=595589 RepID=A0A2T0X969_9RHOB|nr:hypothetical protein [Hasllibacter halocynthiae]PRY95486.1 hypothetical protein BCF33_1107 [Hasllibacter halocynthiae]
MYRDPLDPKGLIGEAYRMERIEAPECRSIFLDWALSTEATPEAIRAMLARHGAEGHPMTAVLREGLEAAPTGRRGGRRARVGGRAGPGPP